MADIRVGVTFNNFGSKLMFVPPNTPFLLPVPIIDRAIIMWQLLQFRIKIKGKAKW